MKPLGLVVMACVLAVFGSSPTAADDSVGTDVIDAGTVANGPLISDLHLISPTTGVADTLRLGMYDPSFSPDGAFVAGFDGETTKSGERVVKVTRMATGRTHRLATFPGDVLAQAWSPGGRRVAVIWRTLDTWRYRVSVVPADRSRPSRLLLTSGRHQIPVHDLAWRADTGELAVLIDGQLVYLSGDGTHARNLVGPCSFAPPALPSCTPTEEFWEFDLSPDGASAVVQTAHEAHLATVTDDGSGEVVPLTDDHGVSVRGVRPVWSPDGTTIAFSSQDTEETELTLMPAGGGQRRVLHTWRLTAADDWQPCPDGRCPSPGKSSPSLSVSAEVLEAAIDVRGVLFDSVFYGQPVTLTLRRWSGDRYIAVDRATAIVGKRGKYGTTFSKADQGRCRVTARYAGDEFFYLPSKAHDEFRCA